jgi:hypothetical protein
MVTTPLPVVGFDWTMSSCSPEKSGDSTYRQRAASNIEKMMKFYSLYRLDVR